MSASDISCVCQLCSKEFTTKAAWYKKGAGKFCSRKCAAIGRPKKQKSGVDITCKNCSKVFTVKKYREHTAVACSNECRRIIWANSPTRKGEKHPNWKGGITLETEKVRRSKEYQNWRISVYKRDKYTCQKCQDATGHNLHAHHIINYSSCLELRFDINNGITLCNNCHNPAIANSFHNIYGTKNNTKEQLEEFLNKQL